MWAKEIAAAGTGGTPGRLELVRFPNLHGGTWLGWKQRLASVPHRVLSPGITAVVGGRPKPSPCLKLYSFLQVIMMIMMIMVMMIIQLQALLLCAGQVQHAGHRHRERGGGDLHLPCL